MEIERYLHPDIKRTTVRALLLIVIFCFPGHLFAQEPFRINGSVTDTDGHPVPGVRVFFKSNPDKRVFSQGDGSFVIHCGNTPDSLKFESVMFEKKILHVSQKQIQQGMKKGSIVLTVVLNDRLLPVATVLPDLPDTVVGTQRYYVEDFAFDARGFLFLLTYENTLSKGSAIRLMNETGDEIGYYPVPDFAIELQNDWRSRVHLICEQKIFWLTAEDELLQVYAEDRATYFRNIAPVIDTVENLVYYSTYSEVYPAFDYYEYNVLDSSHKKILALEDSETMEFYRAEFKYLTNREKVELADMEFQTGIDKEIWAGALYYTNSVYYKPMYAPLFKINNDTVVVFDHYKSFLFNYSPSDSFFRDSVRISYHLEDRRSGWEEPLIQDPVTRKIYAVFQRSGYTFLYEINRQTGGIEASCRLHFKYIERLQIRNGKALYIFRPFESVQRKYLYSENL